MSSAWIAVAAALAGCGRIGFATATVSADADGPPAEGSAPGDGAGTGPVGPRALTIFGASATTIHVAGTRGEAVAILGFVTSLAFDGTKVTGQSPFGSQAVVRFDAAHALVSTATLDATGFCDIRDAAMFGDDVIAAGLSIGGAADASYGPCAVATSRQDAVAVRIDRAGVETTLVPFVSGGTNAQLFHAALLADGSYVLDGVYGDALSIGATALPAVTQDTGFYATYSPTTGAVTWASAVTSQSLATNGPLAVAGTDVCTTGRIGADAIAFGTPLTDAGGNDAWIARVDEAGKPRFVRPIGTPGNNDFAKVDSVVATDLDCVAAFDVSDDVTLDGHVLPVLDGPAIVAAFGPDGAVDYAFRVPGGGAELARAGDKLYLAVTVTVPVKIGGAAYTPAGADVIVVQIDASGLVSLVGVVGGAGDQRLESFAAIAGDALAIGVTSTGAIAFGAHTGDSSGVQVRALATLGVP